MIKKSKYLLSWLLILIMCIGSVVCVSATDTINNPTFSLLESKAKKGETFVVPIGIQDNPGITALQLKIVYDEDYLTLKSVSHEDLFSSKSTCSQKYSSPFKISWFSQDSLDETNNGVLANLTFEVKSSSPVGETIISIEYDADNVFNSRFENIEFNTTNGIVSVIEYIPGDVNSDNVINMKDIVLLQQYLNDFPVDIDESASDVYFDKAINMKDIALLQQYLNDYEVELGNPKDNKNDAVVTTSFVYGQSENGRDLMCYSFAPKNYTDTVLLNFAIHGYEDEYAADGQVLVDTAYELIDYYTKNTESLGNSRLLIIPCANPDGLYDGYTNNGFGRCNAKGIDLNRDFDANYITRTDPRYYTPYAFSASESRALRDLVNDYSADIVIDFHGWLNYTIGDYELAQVFYEELGLSHYTSFTGSNAGGYFANWAHQQGALGLLVEFTNSHSVSIDKVISATNRILQNDYVVLDNDLNFDMFDTIDCYTLSNGRVTTYQFVDKPFESASYIDGATDKCTILDVYDNGWVRVQYPLYNGTNKIAYCYLSDFISPNEMVDEFYEYTVLTNTYVYRRSDMADQFGTVYSTDKIIVVAEKNNMLQIIYNLDVGGYKMGWI